jgi:hypothetical protein
MLFKRPTDFDSALRRCFWARVKDERHPVAGCDLNQTIVCFSFLKLLSPENDLGQLIDSCVLLVNRKLRITNNVDKKNVCDLERDLFLGLDRHYLLQRQ